MCSRNRTRHIHIRHCSSYWVRTPFTDSHGSSGWTVQAAVYSVADITHSTILSSGQSSEFNIVSGGPSPQVSVTVIGESTLSTVGGTMFTPFTPGVGSATSIDDSFTATNYAFTAIATGQIATAGTPMSSIYSVKSSPTGSSSATLASSASSVNSTASGSGINTGTTIGIAVGVVLAVVFLLSLGGLYLFLKRRNTPKKLILDDQAIDLSGRLGSSQETFEKDPGTTALRYVEDDEREEEILSGRVNTVFDSQKVRE